MNRIAAICSYIDKSETFADVGCDHGYCAEYALKSGLCAKVFITDVSAKCLAKAEKLLSRYVDSGKCVPVCCDGLTGLDESCEQVLIAGMGGEEILKILRCGFIPRKFIFQPMKNAPELRSYLIERGCKITADDIFYDGNYYFIIKGEREGGTKEFTKEELLFGRDSLKNPVLKEYAAVEAEKKKSYLENIASEEARNKVFEEYKLYAEIAKK